MSPKSFSRKIGMNVASVCKQLKLPNMSPYWFRHTWATIARNKCGVSKDDIDMCLNHIGNNPMADVYIDYDWSIIDRANRKVLDYVFHSDKE
jgi:integrase